MGGSLQFHWIVPGSNGFGFFLLGWTIFMLLLFLCTLRLSVGLMVLFGLLVATKAGYTLPTGPRS